MVSKKETAQRHPADIPVTTLMGVGPAVAAKLERLNITTAEDLLFHLPFRYEDQTKRTLIADLRPDGEVLSKGKRSPAKSSLVGAGACS